MADKKQKKVYKSGNTGIFPAIKDEAPAIEDASLPAVTMGGSRPYVKKQLPGFAPTEDVLSEESSDSPTPSLDEVQNLTENLLASFANIPILDDDEDIDAPHAAPATDDDITLATDLTQETASTATVNEIASIIDFAIAEQKNETVPFDTDFALPSDAEEAANIPQPTASFTALDSSTLSFEEKDDTIVPIEDIASSVSSTAILPLELDTAQPENAQEEITPFPNDDEDEDIDKEKKDKSEHSIAKKKKLKKENLSPKDNPKEAQSTTPSSKKKMRRSIKLVIIAVLLLALYGGATVATACTFHSLNPFGTAYGLTRVLLGSASYAQVGSYQYTSFVAKPDSRETLIEHMQAQGYEQLVNTPQANILLFSKEKDMVVQVIYTSNNYYSQWLIEEPQHVQLVQVGGI